MKFKFILTKENEWLLKIESIESLIEYWNEFSKALKEACETLKDTKEFGNNKIKHCNNLQNLIGSYARLNFISYENAYEEILFDTKITQYKTFVEHKEIYVNRNFGWNWEKKESVQFSHKNEFVFPVFKKERIKIEKFPLGKHFYVYIDGVQIKENDKIKWNTYEEAEKIAKKYIN